MPFGIVMGNLYYGQNLNDMECLTDTKMNVQPDSSDPVNKLSNTTGFGANLGASYRIGKFAPAIGGGFDSFKNKNYSQRDNNLFLFASVPYTIAPGWNITPSIKLKDLMKDGYGKKEGSEMWYGVLFEVMSLCFM